MREDELVGWHHRLDGHEFEQSLGVGNGQGSLACSSPWGHRETPLTELKTPPAFPAPLGPLQRYNAIL